MLVLTRKAEESIIIGTDIKIKILRTEGNSVEIGISAPRKYSIFREEVYNEIKTQNIQSARSLKNQTLKNIHSVIQSTRKTKK